MQALWREYERELGADLSFQSFEQELAGLPGAYGPPAGALLLARTLEETIGCVGVRPLEPGIAELKRLYVRPPQRGRGAGRLLVQAALEAAARAGYRRIRLDTLPGMETAQALYASLGFREIPSYRHNPMAGTRFLELDLVGSHLLADVRAEVEAPTSPEVRAGRIAELVRSRTGCRWVGIYRVTEREVQNVAWRGPAAPAYPTFPIGAGLTGAAIAEKRIVVSNDVAADRRYLTNQESTGSELIAPIVHHGVVVGTLDVEAAEIGAFAPEQESLYGALAAVLETLFS